MKRKILTLIAILTLAFSFSTVNVSADLYYGWGGYSTVISASSFRDIFDDIYSNTEKPFMIDLSGRYLGVDEDIVLDKCAGTTIEIKNGVFILNRGSRLFDIECPNVTINFRNVVIYTNDSDGDLKYYGAYNGGVFYVGANNVTIQSPDENKPLKISNCHATNCGGAIKLDCYSDGSTVRNVVFENCTADDDGGAIITNGNGNKIENCTFTKCSCKDAGGAIYVWDPCTIEGCTFTGNTSPYGNDIYLADYLKLNKCTFTDHSRSQALYLYGDDYLTEDSGNSFASNISTIMSEGRVWIIGGIAVIAFAAIFLILKKKNKQATQ